MDVKQRPLHAVVMHILVSEPVNAEVCLILEKYILNTAQILGSSGHRTPLVLMEQYLCQDRRNFTDSQSYRRALRPCGCDTIAIFMSDYVRQVSQWLSTE